MYESKRTKLFFDLEFAGLHQNTTPISIGIISQDKQRTFYAEFNDFDQTQVDGWIQENVIKKLVFILEDFTRDNESKVIMSPTNIAMCGNKSEVTAQLKIWLEQFEAVEFWGDCLAYDWILFCELFGGAMKIPKNVFYIPFDIVNLFMQAGIDPDINRVDFENKNSDVVGGYAVHNSSADARLTLDCFLILSKSFQQKLEAK